MFRWPTVLELSLVVVVYFTLDLLDHANCQDISDFYFSEAEKNLAPFLPNLETEKDKENPYVSSLQRNVPIGCLADVSNCSSSPTCGTRRECCVSYLNNSWPDAFRSNEKSNYHCINVVDNSSRIRGLEIIVKCSDPKQICLEERLYKQSRHVNSTNFVFDLATGTLYWSERCAVCNGVKNFVPKLMVKYFTDSLSTTFASMLIIPPNAVMEEFLSVRSMYLKPEVFTIDVLKKSLETAFVTSLTAADIYNGLKWCGAMDPELPAIYGSFDYFQGETIDFIQFMCEYAAENRCGGNYNVFCAHVVNTYSKCTCTGLGDSTVPMEKVRQRSILLLRSPEPTLMKWIDYTEFFEKLKPFPLFRNVFEEGELSTYLFNISVPQSCSSNTPDCLSDRSCVLRRNCCPQYLNTYWHYLAMTYNGNASLNVECLPVFDAVQRKTRLLSVVNNACKGAGSLVEYKTFDKSTFKIYSSRSSAECDGGHIFAGFMNEIRNCPPGDANSILSNKNFEEQEGALFNNTNCIPVISPKVFISRMTTNTIARITYEGLLWCKGNTQFKFNLMAEQITSDDILQFLCHIGDTGNGCGKYSNFFCSTLKGETPCSKECSYDPPPVFNSSIEYVDSNMLYSDPRAKIFRRLNEWEFEKKFNPLINPIQDTYRIMKIGNHHIDLSCFQNVRSCSNVDTCGQYGDCCPDYLSSNWFKVLDKNKVSLHSCLRFYGSGSFIFVPIIDKCMSSAQTFTKKNGPYVTKTLDLYIVNDIDQPKIFYNYHVAACHGYSSPYRIPSVFYCEDEKRLNRPEISASIIFNTLYKKLYCYQILSPFVLQYVRSLGDSPKPVDISFSNLKQCERDEINRPNEEYFNDGGSHLLKSLCHSQTENQCNGKRNFYCAIQRGTPCYKGCTGLAKDPDESIFDMNSNKIFIYNYELSMLSFFRNSNITEVCGTEIVKKDTETQVAVCKMKTCPGDFSQTYKDGVCADPGSTVELTLTLQTPPYKLTPYFQESCRNMVLDDPVMLSFQLIPTEFCADINDDFLAPLVKTGSLLIRRERSMINLELDTTLTNPVVMTMRVFFSPLNMTEWTAVYNYYQMWMSVKENYPPPTEDQWDAKCSTQDYANPFMVSRTDSTDTLTQLKITERAYRTGGCYTETFRVLNTNGDKVAYLANIQKLAKNAAYFGDDIIVSTCTS